MKKTISIFLVLVMCLLLCSCGFVDKPDEFVDKPDEIMINIGDTITVDNMEVTFTEYEWVRSPKRALAYEFDDPTNPNKDFVLKAQVKNIGTEYDDLVFEERKLFINDTYEYTFVDHGLREKEDGSYISGLYALETGYYEIYVEVNQEVNSIAETATVKLKQTDDENADTYILMVSLK